MWHEARKQERKIRGMLVDYKKRAERRREYYEKIKQDPTQFIQIHGRACKIHLDPSVHYAAEAPGSMMQWRGDRESMIDRFDVRAHLDDIPSYDPHSSVGTNPEEVWEERQANYERYRILVQNEFLGIKEEKFLNQIRMEELYGPVGSRAADEEKKALMPKKAAIGFIYDEPSNLNYSGLTQNWNQPIPNEDEEDSGDESDSDIDLDLTVDVFSLSNQQQMDLNTSGIEYGMNKNDFMALINRDLEEAEALRVAKEHEDEKAMFSGRKSRKERRALKKKHFDKKMSPPSYAARASPTYGPYHRFSSNSRSRSNSPQLPTSQIKFITSFGDESGGSDGPDESSRVIIIPESDKTSKGGADNKKDRGTASSRKKNHPRTSSSSRERSRSKSRKRRVSRSTSRHRSRTRSPTRNRRLSRSNSRHRSRTRSPTRNRRDDYRYKSRRRSGSYGRSKRRSPSCSRSRSRSADRWRRKGSRYRSRSRSYSRSPIRSSRVSHKNEVPMPSSSKNGGNLYEQQAVNPSQKLPSPPRRRYYGRRAENSDSDLDSEDESTRTFSKGQRNEATSSYSVSNAFSFGNESNTDKGYSSSKLNPKERLRKKMQALLKKQYKMDKKLEKEKAEKAERERMDREEELREIAIKLRRRERERRHRYHDDYSGSDDSYEFRSSSRSPSRSSKSPPRKSKSRELSIERRSSERESRRCDRESSRERGKEREKSRYRRSRERSYDREDSKRSHYREESRRARNSSRRRSQSRSRNDRSSYEDDSPTNSESRKIRLVDY